MPIFFFSFSEEVMLFCTHVNEDIVGHVLIPFFLLSRVGSIYGVNISTIG